MDFIPPVQVMVSGVRSAEEARHAVSFGVAALGFATDFPDEEPIGVEEIAAMSDAVGRDIGTFLLTSIRDPAALVDIAVRSRVNTLQIWEPLPPEAYDQIRSAVPGLAIAQSIHVTEEAALDRAIAMSGLADALVLDSLDPYCIDTAQGTGDYWQTSRRIVDSVQMPVILSGDLTPHNIADAVRAVRPFGVRVHPVSHGSLDAHQLVELLEVIGRLHL